MIEQQGTALTFYAFYTEDGAGDTGLTVTVDVYEDTATAAIVTGASATELGGGFYYYTLAGGSNDNDGAYVAVFKTADGNTDQQHIPAIWSIGNTVNSDVTAISGDATAADNAEAFFDDTGFTASNSVIGTVTTNTDLVTAAAIWTYATRTLTAGIAGITVVTAVSGSTISVYENDTWSFTVTDSNLSLSDYEALAFIVKRNEDDTDNESIVYIRDDTDLQRINGAAPVASGNGSMTSTATSFTIKIALAETDFGGGWTETWWLKGYDTTPNPDEAYTLATGTFAILKPGLQATT